jgi:hypothetical protein
MTEPNGIKLHAGPGQVLRRDDSCDMRWSDDGDGGGDVLSLRTPDWQKSPGGAMLRESFSWVECSTIRKGREVPQKGTAPNMKRVRRGRERPRLARVGGRMLSR